MSTDLETTTLNRLKAVLRTTPFGRLDLDTVDEVEAAARCLAKDEPHWIDAEEAAPLLGFPSTDGVAAWVRLGLIRAHPHDGDTLRVRLDDVLYRRAQGEGLTAFGDDDELTEEEMELHFGGRRGKHPWEQEESTSSP